MLWVWVSQYFWKVVREFGVLLIPPPVWAKQPSASHRVIDVNADCPGCGHRDGKIECVPRPGMEAKESVIEHTCKVCGAFWYEATVIADNASLIYPASHLA